MGDESHPTYKVIEIRHSITGEQLCELEVRKNKCLIDEVYKESKIDDSFKTNLQKLGIFNLLYYKFNLLYNGMIIGNKKTLLEIDIIDNYYIFYIVILSEKRDLLYLNDSNSIRVIDPETGRIIFRIFENYICEHNKVLFTSTKTHQDFDSVVLSYNIWDIETEKKTNMNRFTFKINESDYDSIYCEKMCISLSKNIVGYIDGLKEYFYNKRLTIIKMDQPDNKLLQVPVCAFTFSDDYMSYYTDIANDDVEVTIISLDTIETIKKYTIKFPNWRYILFSADGQYCIFTSVNEYRIYNILSGNIEFIFNISGITNSERLVIKTKSILVEECLLADDDSILDNYIFLHNNILLIPTQSIFSNTKYKVQCFILTDMNTDNHIIVGIEYSVSMKIVGGYYLIKQTERKVFIFYFDKWLEYIKEYKTDIDLMPNHIIDK
jgi:hypothetical protein